MSNLKIKIFSSDSQHYNNQFGQDIDYLIDDWLENRDEIEIIDCELKTKGEGNSGGVVIVKYRESTRRKIMTEKKE